MKISIKLLFWLLVVTAFFYGYSQAQIVPICYGCDQPLGADGMQSNYAFNTLTPTQIQYGLNVDTWTHPGEVRKRIGTASMPVGTGINNVSLYGAWGNNNVKLNVSVILGIEAHATYGIGQFCYTDSFETALQDNNISEEIFPYKEAAHDFTDVGNFTIHCDGKSIPSIFVQEQTFKVNDSVPDSTGWSPHMISMGLEAPGQLRAQVTSTSGNLNGAYQYAIALMKRESGSEGGCGSGAGYEYRPDTIRPLGLPSATVYPENQKVLVSLFENYPPQVYWYTTGEYYNWCYPDSTGVLLLRKKIDGRGEWFVIDTLIYPIDSQLVYLDNLSDTITATIDSASAADGASINMPKPGQFRRLYSAGGGGFATDTGNYRIAYSYYDPITGIESPLGPTVSCGGANDTIFAKLSKGWSDSNRPKWIRVYQSINNILLAGGGDTTVFWGVFQLRANDCILGEVSSGNGEDSLVIGDSATWGLSWADTLIVGGLDSAEYPKYIDTIGTFYDFHRLTNAFGDPVTIPPHKYANQLPFKDIEYYEGRLWGVGDPACPSCIYYSEVNAPPYSNVFSWNPSNVWDIDEGVSGDIMALERAEGFGADALYAFKRDAIYLITGGVNNLRIRIVKIGVGAISKKSITRHEETVYFLSPDMKIYGLKGIEVQEISSPIENWIDSIFYDNGIAPTYCVAFELGDAVKWFNTGTVGNPVRAGKAGYGLSFDTKSGHWSIQQYGRTGAYVPVGTFMYDTSTVDNSNVQVIYSDSALALRSETIRAYTDAGSETNWAVWFPFYGDYVNNYQMQKIQFTLGDKYNTSQIRYGVYNQDGDSICADAAVLGASQDDNLSIHLPFNEDKFLQLRVWMNAGEQYTLAGETLYRTQRISLYNIIETVRNMGVSVFSKILMIVLVSVFVPKQFEIPTKTYWDEKEDGLSVLSTAGETMGKSYRGAMSTRELIDTVRIYNDTGRVRLNAFASKKGNKTVPTNSDRFNVIITARDALEENLSWQWDYVNFKDNAEIQIRNNGDSSFSGLVDVQIKVR